MPQLNRRNKATFWVFESLTKMSKTAEFDQKNEKRVESGYKSLLYYKDACIIRVSIPHVTT